MSCLPTGTLVLLNEEHTFGPQEINNGYHVVVPLVRPGSRQWEEDHISVESSAKWSRKTMPGETYVFELEAFTIITALP